MCNHQQRFGLDVQFSALVHNFNIIFCLLASVAGRDVFQMPAQQQAVDVMRSFQHDTTNINRQTKKMTKELQDFLTYYLPNEDLKPLLDKFTELKIKKNRHLLKPEMDCNYLAFVQSGSFRVYHYDLKEKEINTWFSFPEMVITDLLGLYTTGKAQFYVEALEDSIIYKISKQDLETLYIKNPMYREFERKFAEEALTMLMQRTMSLHTKSAEDRYKELLQQPDFMQKIPLKYLASYLGITDTSLSRIRKNIR